jgi:hypothetical protein
MSLRRFRFAAALVVAPVLASFVAPAALMAQHAGGAQPTSTRAPKEATQYDFLIGQWELAVRPTVSGLAARLHGAPKMSGSWKAWRALEGWGVEDELRIVDESGNPRALTHFVRVYDATAKTWRISAVDAYRGAVTQTTAAWNGSVFEAPGNGGTDDDGKTFSSRTRITDVTPASFSYLQERSFDAGKKWEVTLRIEAKRISATAPR